MASKPERRLPEAEWSPGEGVPAEPRARSASLRLAARVTPAPSPPGQRPPPSAGSRSRLKIKTPPARSGEGSGGRGRAAPRAALTCRRLLAGGPAGRARWHHTAGERQRCRCPLLRQPRRRQHPAAVPVLPQPHGEHRSPAALRAGRADSAARRAPHAATIALLPALRRALPRPTSPPPRPVPPHHWPIADLQ